MTSARLLIDPPGATAPLTGPRLPDWQSRLQAYCFAVAHRPFGWGRHDCFHFAAGAVQALTGRHPAPDLCGRYGGPLGAARILSEGGGLQALVCERLGPPLPAPGLARDGDIGLVPTPDGEGLAVRSHLNWLMPTITVGLAALPGDAAVQAWRVG